METSRQGETRTNLGLNKQKELSAGMDLRETIAREIDRGRYPAKPARAMASVQVADRVLATVREAGWKSEAEHNHIFAAYEAQFYQRDALQRKLDALTRDAAVEAAFYAYNDGFSKRNFYE